MEEEVKNSTIQIHSVILRGSFMFFFLLMFQACEAVHARGRHLAEPAGLSSRHGGTPEMAAGRGKLTGELPFGTRIG